MDTVATQVQAAYRLAPLQQGMLYHHMVGETPGLDIMQLVMRIPQALDEDRTRHALHLVAARHDALRTLILYRQVEVPRQVVLKKRNPGFTVYDWRAADDAEAQLARLRDADVSRGFDLERDPLWRIGLVFLPSGCALVLTMHHIIMDGWSLETIIADFARAYTDLSGADPAVLADSPAWRRPGQVSYGDFVAWVESQDPRLDYWRDLLAGYDEPVCPPPDTDGEPGPGTVRVTVPDELSARMAVVAASLDVTVNALLEAAWGVALGRYGPARDAVFGEAVSGRNAPLRGIGTVVGLFVNTIPVRVRVGASDTVADLLRALHRQGLESNEHVSATLADVQQTSPLGRALISSLFTFENHAQVDADSREFLGAQVTMEYGEEVLGYPFSFKAWQDEHLHLNLMYNEAYGRTGVERLAGRLVGLLDQMTASPHALVSACEFLPPAEQAAIDGRARPAVRAAAPADAGEFIAPRDDDEVLVEAAFQHVLGLSRPIGVREDFLALGGHSLRAQRGTTFLQARSGVRVPVRAWFTSPTIEGLAQVLRDARARGRRPTSTPEPAVATPVPAAAPDPASRAGVHPMSSPQRRLFAVCQIDDLGTAYNTPMALELTGEVDADRLEAALGALTRRHGALRTCFRVGEGDLPVQVVLPPGEVTLPLERRRLRDDDTAESLLAGFVRPFDLARAPLMRVCAASGAGRTIVLVDFHHIIADGASVAVLMEDLAAFYDDGPDALGAAPQYATWSEQARTRDLSAQKAYWNGVFARETPPGDLPLDTPRGVRQQFAGGAVAGVVPASVRRGVEALARAHRGTPYMVFLAAQMALLRAYTRQSDVTIGSPVSGRTTPGAEGAVGMFVNTLALRAHPAPRTTFAELLDEVTQVTLAALENQDYPFEDLVDDVAWLRRDLARNPLFDVMLALQNNEPPVVAFTGLDLVRTVSTETPARFDLTWNIAEAGETYAVDLLYASALFRRDTAERMMGAYLRLLAAAVEAPGTALADLPLMDEAERRLILEEFSGAGDLAPIAEQDSFVTLFEAQVAAGPDRVALALDDDRLTYAGLQARAGAVAAWLVDAGVRRGDLVGIVAGAGFGHVTAALGIMMAGAAFVPLDASTPPERAAFILRDAGVTAVCLADAPLPCDADVPVLDVAALVAEAGAAARVDLPAPGAADLAYCIYTSGTTGVPKGVLLEHRGLVNLVRYYSGDLRITPADTILQFASPAFDASVWDMTMALSGGATLRMLPHDGAWDPDGLRDGLRSCTVATLPPALALATGPSGLRLLITAASAATPAVVECARECGRYVNGYGPTETTVAASSWGHTPGEPVPDVVPIGRPLPGVSVYVLDGLEPCPVGVPGELCVGGAGVARGYLNRPELTAERFIDNPYGEGRLYRTGDVARWLQDGNLEFLGRTDDQVKIRGYRIELGEIEATLAGLPGVREAAVVVRTAGDGEAALCGYVAAEGSDSDTLLAGLARHLPAYMVPDQLVVLGALPHNTSGKVDKAALPIVVAPNAGPHVAPAGAAELAVAACFEAILGARDGDDDAGVHADADFFALGGDSIKAIRMVSRLREAGYGTTVRDIITARTLRRIAAGLTGAPAAAASNEPVTGEVPLTPIQRAFFAAGHARPGHFNQAVFLRSSEPLDEAALGEALAALARHHDMLRACYPGGVQRVRAVDEGPLYALTSIDTRGRRVDPVQVGAFNDAIQASFDLETGPLLAACRHRTDDGDHLLLAIHHLVVDGVSWRILAEDLANAYAQARAGATPRLPDKTASFRDWALLLEEIVTSGAAAAEDDYWRTTAGQAQTHDLRPSRAPAPGAAGYARTAIRATADVTAGLLRGTGAYEVDQVLLAAFALAAGRWSGQAQVGFEVEGHGREPWTRTVAVDRTVGWFTSWYPVVLPTRGDAGDVLAATREVLHGVPHGGLGYGLLHGVGAPHPGWVFNYLGQADAEQTGPLTPSPWPAGATIAPENRLPNAVSMNGSIAGGVLTFDVTYDTALWHEADVQAFARAYETALTEVVAHCAAAPRLAAPGVSAAEADEIASLFE